MLYIHQLVLVESQNETSETQKKKTTGKKGGKGRGVDQGTCGTYIFVYYCSTIGFQGLCNLEQGEFSFIFCSNCK